MDIDDKRRIMATTMENNKANLIFKLISNYFM